MQQEFNYSGVEVKVKTVKLEGEIIKEDWGATNLEGEGGHFDYKMVESSTNLRSCQGWKLRQM